MFSFLWGLIPGLGQIHYGCPGRGLGFFFLFAFTVNLCLVMPLIVSDRVVHSSLIAIAVLFWLISFIDNLALSAEWELGRRTPE